MKNSDYLYLDHAATTPMREVALKAFIELKMKAMQILLEVTIFQEKLKIF